MRKTCAKNTVEKNNEMKANTRRRRAHRAEARPLHRMPRNGTGCLNFSSLRMWMGWMDVRTWCGQNCHDGCFCPRREIIKSTRRAKVKGGRSARQERSLKRSRAFDCNVCAPLPVYACAADARKKTEATGRKRAGRRSMRIFVYFFERGVFEAVNAAACA